MGRAGFPELEAVSVALPRPGWSGEEGSRFRAEQVCSPILLLGPRRKREPWEELPSPWISHGISEADKISSQMP